jgi:hypothetical protein
MINSFIQKNVIYLKNHTFKKHSSGNYGMYGLNFIGTNVVIKINDELWKFLYWEPGTENATFINSDSKLIIFNPRNIYYSDKRNTIMRMEEQIKEEV